MEGGSDPQHDPWFMASGGTYRLKVVIEPDEDSQGNPAWHAYCPALLNIGAATSGRTRDEALKNINEVVGMIFQEFIEEGTRFQKAPPTPSR